MSLSGKKYKNWTMIPSQTRHKANLKSQDGGSMLDIKYP